MNKILIGIVWNEKQSNKLNIMQESLLKTHALNRHIVIFDDSKIDKWRIKLFTENGYPIMYKDTSRYTTIQEKTVVGRNLIREYFLNNTDCTHIFWLDGDILIPDNIIERLLEPKLDNITAIRPQHGGTPGVFPFRDELQKDFYKLYSMPNFRIINWEWLCPSRIAEISCYGFGCNLISRKATESCEFWCKPFSPATEDILYCMDLQIQGFPAYADTGLLCRHYYDELKRPDERFDYGGDWSALDNFRKHTKQWRNK